jgi:hypothetical protein
VNHRFLLVDLHLDYLFNQPAKGDLLRALETLPQSVELLYLQTLQRIDRLPADTRAMAYKALSWVLFAWRPLSIVELRYALALRLGGNQCICSDDLLDEDAIISSCAGLIAVNATTRRVSFLRKC